MAEYSSKHGDSNEKEFWCHSSSGVGWMIARPLGLQLRHAHSEPSNARIDAPINEHPRVPADAGLDAPHGRDPGDSTKIARQ